MRKNNWRKIQKLIYFLKNYLSKNLNETRKSKKFPK